MAACTRDLSSWEAEAGGTQAQSQHGLHHKILPLKRKKKKKKHVNYCNYLAQCLHFIIKESEAQGAFWPLGRAMKVSPML